MGPVEFVVLSDRLPSSGKRSGDRRRNEVEVKLRIASAAGGYVEIFEREELR
jgi:hypothetical protein